jgi:MoaA/NifB/PqqE/SkfB family radical SAM enzyme
MWHRLSTKLSYRFNNLFKAWAYPPEGINIYPTDRCNLKCSMCFEKLRTPNKEIDITEWIKIINQIKTFRPRIHLSGGEPFVYPKIIDLISYIRQCGLFLSITTNGTFLKKYADEIISLGVNRINVSIDGPREIHDKIRGVKGTYNRIMEGLKIINELKKSHGQPAIQVHSMINLSNPEIMQQVIKTAIHLEAEAVKFLHPLFVNAQSLKSHQHTLIKCLGRGLNYWQKADVSCDKPQDFRKTEKILLDLQKERSIPVEIFPQFNFDQLKAYYNVESDFLSIYEGHCQTMWNTATILASGEVESCPDYVFGNCREEHLKVLWNNEIMRGLRNRIRKRQYFAVCRGCCSFYQ